MSKGPVSPASPPKGAAQPLRLHIGGEQVKEGWKILNIQPKPGVDFIGDCTDLSQFPDRSVDEIYASHVYEHLDYASQFPRALGEAHRVLKPGGLFRAGVPDLEALARLVIDPVLPLKDRWDVQRMIFGGQIDAHDYHKIGLTFDFFRGMLEFHGFKNIRRVEEFGLFDDITARRFYGRRISLNVVANK